MTTKTAHRKLTQDELMTEATARFGTDPMKFAFQCPRCSDVASLQDFKDAGASPGMAGQECIGRTLGALKKEHGPNGEKYAGRGCDWTAYGLLRGPWEVVVPAEGDKPERSVWGFPLADPTTSGPSPDDQVWIAAARREIEAHRPDGDRTGCRRSMRTGQQLTAAEATERHGAKWCPRCWPAPS